MTRRTHAQHRPAVDQDPARSSPQTSFGWIYPEGDIVAVVEDRASGDRAMLELKQAGVSEGDMDLVDPAWFLAGEHAVEEHRTFWQRLGALVAQEEGDLIKEYLEEARQGHPFCGRPCRRRRAGPSQPRRAQGARRPPDRVLPTVRDRRPLIAG